MLFNSYTFLLFLPITLIILKASSRWQISQKILLLIASNIFYGYWDVRFLGLLWVSIFVDYVAARVIFAANKELYRRLAVCLSVIANLGILCFFKYFNFFQESLADILSALHISYQAQLFHIVLPIGISFYTFQSMSYTIDVYRGERPAERNLLDVAQFVCFFPQLVAGPIERAGHLMPQLQKRLNINLENFLSGLILLSWGLFKKVVVADITAKFIVDPQFSSPISLAHVIILLFGFSIQIYCDFSGYCDVARGVARMMGIDIIDNFYAPYWAVNIREFWRKWHVSLSNWFRDYLYIPLGGSKKGVCRTYINLVITMGLCGLWHGADIKFILWGLFHGVFLIISRVVVFPPVRYFKAFFDFCSKAGTFILVTIGWGFFRGDDAFFHRVLVLIQEPHNWFIFNKELLAELIILIVMFMFVSLSHYFQSKEHEDQLAIEDVISNRFALGCFIAFLWLSVFVLGESMGDYLPFIYFQF